MDGQQEENKILTPAQTTRYKKQVEDMYGLACPVFVEVKSEGMRILIGLGQLGMHVRFFDKRVVEEFQEKINLTLETEKDEDHHISILKPAILGFGLCKRITKQPAADRRGPDEEHVSWMVDVIYAPGSKIGVAFSKKEQAIEFKDFLWKWRLDLITLNAPRLAPDPVIPVETTTQQTPARNEEEQ